MTAASKPETAIRAGAVEWGYCGEETCTRPAVYEVRFSDWPEGVRTGCCADHAADARRQDNLAGIWTYGDAA